MCAVTAAQSVGPSLRYFVCFSSSKMPHNVKGVKRGQEGLRGQLRSSGVKSGVETQMGASGAKGLKKDVKEDSIMVKWEVWWDLERVRVSGVLYS